MKSIQSRVFAGALLSATLAGCVTPTPEIDRTFGQSVNAAKAQQTINPDASKNRDPVAGIDGTAAKEAIDRYQSSFKSPPPAANVINIGTGGGR